jgi:capsular exopolysaccharide synthesis family protein
MSRNFDLMQEMERDKALRSNLLLEPAFAIPGQKDNKDDRKSNGDLTQGLVHRIFLQQKEEPPRLVVLAGMEHGNGCSQVAASVAESLAVSGAGTVCLVEANFRSPGQAAIFGTTNYDGLRDALVEEGPIKPFLKAVNDSLWLLSSGPVGADSPALLTSDRMRARSAELREEFDFVIVDVPPLTRYPDAMILGPMSDGIILVLEAEATRREAARATVETLRLSGIQVLGAVLNKRIFPIPEKIYNKL